MRSIKFQVCAQLAKSMARQRKYLAAARAMLREHKTNAARFWLCCWKSERATWQSLRDWKAVI